MIFSAVGPAARAALEEMMKSGYQYQSEFAKKYVAEGELHACREILASQLEQRFGSLPSKLQQRIATEADLDQLHGWLGRVVTMGRSTSWTRNADEPDAGEAIMTTADPWRVEERTAILTVGSPEQIFGAE